MGVVMAEPALKEKKDKEKENPVPPLSLTHTYSIL